ncbi:PEP-CTERM sorting domain-containing protein [Mucisphaera calidilacus]|uniref:Uncharacterized protein n=1 Tax=Mucisphaera calidilacus TaxID=2527982 RepID=A0A518BUG7_9BACT|nr:PEP-CTERM sorting domain-containing protein [Mucisphaera calidilacus]QDU70629.1 hypothetical protein Pan265_04570 [Mucisphaera calidilacus]
MSMNLKTTSALLTVAFAATTASANFMDDFDSVGELANNYGYFHFGTNEGGAGLDANTFSNGASFALDDANSKVNLYLPDPGGFNFLRLTRGMDAENLYDMSQPVQLSAKASGLDNLNFDSIRNPFGLGLDFPEGTNPDITVKIQLTRSYTNPPTSRIQVQANDGSSFDLPGGAQQTININVQNKDIVFDIDADSYSLTIGNTVVIPDTLHGIVFDTAVGGTPFIEAQHIFDGGATDFSVEYFAGTGTAIPEPASLAMLALGGIAMIRRSA